MALERVNGIQFGDLHSYYDLGMWLSERPDYGSPEPKTNLVEVPGMDGVLDMTEANSGDVKYSNRTLTFTFAKMVSIGEQEEFKSLVRNALHGRYINQIIPDEDPYWYYSGRAVVEFTDITPWKMRCIVTVDAAPYAQNVFTYALTLEPVMYEVETQEVTVADAGSRTMLRPWLSVFALGTKVFPDGLPEPFGSTLKIGWNDPPTSWMTVKTIKVYDADGDVYTHNFTPAESARAEYITFSDIEQAGVDLEKVYRVDVFGIGECTLSTEAHVAHIPVENKRKTVMPMFELIADAPVEIMVNGVVKEVPIGESQSTEIVLRGGMNDIYVADNPSANIRFFMMYYREGKL